MLIWKVSDKLFILFFIFYFFDGIVSLDLAKTEAIGMCPKAYCACNLR